MIKITGSLLLVVMSVTVQAQKGEQFPDLTGYSLAGDTITLPKETKGKYTLIGMAYSKKADEDLQTWFSPVYNTFIREQEEPSLFHVDYDVNLYFIPMFTGLKALAANKAMRKSKKQLDDRLHPYVLFYKGALNTYRKDLGLEEKDTPYFFVLDKNGKIVHTISGRYTDQKIIKVEEIVDPRKYDSEK